MTSAICIYDAPSDTPNLIAMTREQLQIPGLNLLRRHSFYNAEERFLWHYHENILEITVPFNGNFLFSTRKKTYSVTRGDVFITFPSEEYTVGPGQLAPGQLIWLQIDISKADKLLFLCPEAAKELLENLKSLPTISSILTPKNVFRCSHVLLRPLTMRRIFC